MLHTTRWRPDTCGCTIEYEWDDAQPEDARVHHLSKISQCEHHAHLDGPGAFEGVKGENRGKNKALAKLSELTGIDSRDVSWKFGRDRVLELDHRDLRGRSKSVRDEVAKASGLDVGIVGII